MDIQKSRHLFANHKLMLSTKLLLIEGLPGSGKTSLAKHLSKKLDQNGIIAHCYLEETSHHPTLAPWDDDPETFLQSSVETWRGFTNKVAVSEWTTIVEGNFFQSTPRLLLQQDAKQARIQAYIKQVEGIIGILNPALIYLHPKNIAVAVQKICAQRGSEWQSYFVRAVTENPYGKRKNLKGLDGAIAFMKTYNSLCENMFASLEITKVIIDLQDKDWERCYREITLFLDL